MLLNFNMMQINIPNEMQVITFKIVFLSGEALSVWTWQPRDIVVVVFISNFNIK